MPSNKQQLEKGGGREGDSVAHHREEREEERAWAPMRSSLNLKKGANEAPCHQTDMGMKDESGLMGSGCWGHTKASLFAPQPSFLRPGSQRWENEKLRDKGRTW